MRFHRFRQYNGPSNDRAWLAFEASGRALEVLKQRPESLKPLCCAAFDHRLSVQQLEREEHSHIPWKVTVPPRVNL